MQLRGQQRGYAMAALLVGLGVMSVMLTVAMPVWTQITRREREAELVFRGEQYKRALDLFQRRNGPGVAPPSVEVLVEGHFLRKAFKDPITGDDFLLLRAGAAIETAGGGPQNGRGVQAGRGGTPGRPPGFSSGGEAFGGIVGVASRSTEESLRVYNGRTRYNEWDFTFVQQTQTPGVGAGGPGAGGIGGPGAGGGPAGPPGVPGLGLGGRGRGRGPQPNSPAPRGRGPSIDAPSQGGGGQTPPAPPGR